jgi:hypothetical protein
LDGLDDFIPMGGDGKGCRVRYPGSLELSPFLFLDTDILHFDMGNRVHRARILTFPLRLTP